MHFLRSWLEDYIDLSTFGNKELSEKISLFSSEVEGFVEIKDYFGGLVQVGRIENVKKHENADTLNVFEVNLGTRSITIVSAAPNVREGLLVPVALVGARLADMTIAERPMRGITSAGMCCGKSELGLEAEFSSGLWELNCDDSQLGQSICIVYPDLFPLDTLFDVKVLPDRIGNIGNYIGMAIELAHILKNPELLKGIALAVHAGDYSYTPKDIEKETELTLNFSDQTGLSSVFNVFRAKFDKEFVLPTLFKNRLFLTNTNLVNPLADYSNYLTAVTGQPVHFFSTQKVFGGRTTRTWRLEELKTPTEFNGLGNLKNTILPSETIVLKDESTILTVPALVGGETTKVSENDLDILIEIPIFTPTLAMRSSFRTKYRTEGSKIWASRAHASRIAIALSCISQDLTSNLTSLVLSEDGKQDAITFATQEKKFEQPFIINFDWEWMAVSYNRELSSSVKELLLPHANLLGKVEGNTLIIPNQAYTFVSDQASLLAELSYLEGVGNVRPSSLTVNQIPPYHTQDFEILIELKKRLTQLGFDEVITRPFVTSGVIKVLKPQNENMNYLRSRLFESVLQTAGMNYQNGVEIIRFFELNKVYPSIDGKEVRELNLFLKDANALEITNLVQTILSWWEQTVIASTTTQIITERGKETIWQNDKITIIALEVANLEKKKYGLPLKPIWILDVNCTDLEALTPNTHYSDTASHPLTTRDYTIINNQSWRELYNILSQIQSNYCSHFTPLDTISKDGVNSTTVRFSLGGPDHTVRPENITEFESRLFQVLQNNSLSLQ